MRKSDWTKTKKKDLSYQESIWYYVLEVDHENDLSTMTCDETESDGAIGLARLWVGVWYGVSRDFMEIPRDERS